MHADGDGDDDVDSVSPRTLRQAADRLARFTSDQPAGVLCLAALLLLSYIVHTNNIHHPQKPCSVERPLLLYKCIFDCMHV